MVTAWLVRHRDDSGEFYKDLGVACSVNRLIDTHDARHDWIDNHPGARIGMSADTVKNETAWGKPDHVNRTVTASGVREQWVYPGYEYLYFEDGRLVAIQDKP